ncbi:hypothetical protein Salat_1448000 [Sesamum alatum]|uniref:DUF4283 domain-containing protein n=1 Tax=Sesamum alatum TaxID=300844 RepID=A0AAE1YBZ3_9LAMI|nr:hypothetical protein Salat_1448000 [Sesamum alatum]
MDTPLFLSQSRGLLRHLVQYQPCKVVLADSHGFVGLACSEVLVSSSGGLAVAVFFPRGGLVAVLGACFVSTGGFVGGSHRRFAHSVRLGVSVEDLVDGSPIRFLMEAEIQRLGWALQLTEDEGNGLRLSEDLCDEPTTGNDLFLVGRLLIPRDVNFKGLARSLKGMMNPVKGMDIKASPEGRFLLHFNHTIDKQRVLARCPWSFEKGLIILNDVPTNANPMHVDLNWCDFIVHVHDLPLSKVTLGVAPHIGNQLGLFEELETDDQGHAWGATLHMRVALNVNSPLTRALKLFTPSERFW